MAMGGSGHVKVEDRVGGTLWPVPPTDECRR